jgi:hypothetical protein
MDQTGELDVARFTALRQALGNSTNPFGAERDGELVAIQRQSNQRQSPAA